MEDVLSFVECTDSIGAVPQARYPAVRHNHVHRESLTFAPLLAKPLIIRIAAQPSEQRRHHAMFFPAFPSKQHEGSGEFVRVWHRILLKTGYRFDGVFYAIVHGDRDVRVWGILESQGGHA